MLTDENGDIYYGTGIETVKELPIEIKGLPELVKEENSAVKHPKHYQFEKPLTEVMDVIREMTKNYKGIEAFSLGNFIKYNMRAGKKDVSKTKEDTDKGIYYLKLFLQELEK